MRRALCIGPLLLAACAGPRSPSPPDAAVAAPASWARGASSPSKVDRFWWHGFRSPDLDALVARALERNADIEIALTRVQRAEAMVRLVHGQALPAVGFGGAVTRERDVDAFGHPQLQRAWSGSFQASYDVDLFGRIADATAAARASLEGTAAARDAMRLSVTVAVTRTYFDLLVQHETLEVARKTLGARAESLKVAERRFAAGYGTDLDLRRAQAEYQDAAALLPAARLAIGKDEDALRTLVGDWPSAVPVAVRLADVALPEVPVGVPSAVLRQRPDIAQAEDALIAADHSLDSARAAYMPQLTLTADGGYVGSTLLPAPVKVFSIGAGLLVPLFEGGRLDAQQDIAASQRDEAAWTYRKAALGAFAEVEGALDGVKETAAREAAIAAEHAAIQVAYQQARNRYREGYADYLEQLDAERSLLSTDLAVLQARQARLDATVALMQSLGGGWQRPDDSSESE